jgi:hypothetical protein
MVFCCPALGSSGDFCYAFRVFHLGARSRRELSGERSIREAIVVRRIMGFFCLLGCLGIGHRALAQEFSADVVTSKAGNAGFKKVYAGKDKVRFEVEGRNPAMGPTSAILDEAQHKYIVLIAERHMYMDAPLMMIKPLITQFWRVQDVDDACPQWKKTAEQAGTDKNWGSCTKVGSDSVNGRSAVKYEGVSSKGEKGYVWVDTKLHCVVKTDGANGSMELRNIQEGSQPASLFEIPSGYTKFDMGSMMRQQQ